MGILDEAIREHLELKRQHGAEESEIAGLEAEAFGPADRPDSGEDETRVISPGSSVTAPAGEGDQLDKVFEATRAAEAAGQEGPAGAEAGDPAGPSAEAAPVEVASAEPSAEAPAPSAPAEEDRPEPEAAAPASPAEVPAPPAEPESEEASSAPAPEEGDAGDLLEAERHHLASHPTEHYDVDAAIAEEDEIDLLSESSLSDELDRALDGPAPAAESAAAAAEPAPAPAEPEAEVAEEPETADEPEPEVEGESESEDESEGEDDAEGDAEAGADFFDQEDPLEGTPDFLEETPEHDRLWFEQKEPKDFDFGD